MPCPTCDHTMENVGITGNGGNVFHCPRCGTVSQQYDGERFDYVPKIVLRCREYERSLSDPDQSWSGTWRRLGIAESINLPAQRPA